MDLLFILLNNKEMDSKIDFNEVAVFIKVIQKGSFIGAALALGMPKSTVSTKVSNLEKRLGISLLRRSTRNLKLTQDGESFYRRSMRGIEEILAAEVEVKSEIMEPHGRLRISAPVDIGGTILTELICNFLKKYPKVNFEILLGDRYVDFLEEEIDLAVRAGDLEDSSLIAKKVGEVVFGVYASPKYLKIQGAPLHPHELVTHSCILFSSISSSEWRLENSKKTVTVLLPNRIVVNDINLAHSFALSGEGLAFIPSFLCMSAVKSGKLVRVLGEWSSNISPIHFVYPAQAYVSSAVKMFIEMSTPLMQSRFSIEHS